MNDKEAANILIGMMSKYPLTDQEREALKAGIGILAWTSLAENRIKALKARREKKKGA